MPAKLLEDNYHVKRGSRKMSAEIKVVVLCGGHGHRLRPLTKHVPKPLVTLNGKPVIQHIIEFYIKKGFCDFILCVGYRAAAIRKFVLTRSFNANIEISDCGADAGILKRLYFAKNILGERSIVTYGDTFINIEPARILAEHRKRGAGATITVADIRSPFGLVKSDSKNIARSFEEKPTLQYYIGHMIMETDILFNLGKKIVSMPDGQGLVRLFHQLIKHGKLNIYRHKGLKITFNTPHEYKKAEEEFVKFFTEQEG